MPLQVNLVACGAACLLPELTMILGNTWEASNEPGAHEYTIFLEVLGV